MPRLATPETPATANEPAVTASDVPPVRGAAAAEPPATANEPTATPWVAVVPAFKGFDPPNSDGCYFRLCS